MGRTVDKGIRDSSKIASQELKDAREELRKQLLYRDIVQRELEFLENGGNPLDFRFGSESSVSVQSISLTGQQQEQIVTSKEKVDLSLIGDLVHSEEPTTWQRVKVCNANTAENLLHVDGENQPAEVENNSINLNIKRNIAPSKQSSQVKGTQNGKEPEESTIFRPYARRNRSKPNRSVSRSALVDVRPSQGGVHVPVPSRYGSRDTNGSLSGSNHVNCEIFSIADEKSTSSIPDKTLIVTDISKLDSKCSPDVERAAGILQESSNKDSLYMLTYAGPLDGVKDPAHVVDANRTLKDESTEVVFRRADLPSNGCSHSENANKSDESNAVVTQTKSRGIQGITQAEAENDASAVTIKTLDSESFTRNSLIDGDTCPIMVIRQPILRENCKTSEKGTIRNVIERDIGQISTDGEKIDRQNQIDCILEVGIQEMSEMNVDVKAGDRFSTVSNGPEPRSHVVSGIGSIHGNSSVCDRNLDTGGTVNEQPIAETVKISLATSSRKDLIDASETQTCFTKELGKVDEDSILAEALLIEAKHKRMSELLMGTPQSGGHQKCHWDFVLEEMAWLANDFMQERLWKISAAAQFGHRAALASCQRVEEKTPLINMRIVARSNARAVLQFWQSVESFVHAEDRKKHCLDQAQLPLDTQEAVEDQTEESKIIQEPKFVFERRGPIKDHAIKKYAIRFLKYNASVVPHFNAEARLSPDCKSSLGTDEKENLLKNDLADESLFYKVPAGAIECYRKSIESHVLQCEVSGSRLEEADLYDATDERMYMGEERERDISFCLGAFDGRMASKTADKKRKNLVNAYMPGTYVGADLTFGRHPGGFYSRSVLTKGTRTASRQRVASPYDASSEDTNYFQDDQSNANSDYQIEYSVNSEKNLQLNTRGDSTKNKKKKKTKRPNSLQDQRWQLHTALSNGQRDLSRKRLENQRLEYSEINGTTGQSNAKRSKTVKQYKFLDLNSRTVPSFTDSQMSNKPNQFKFMRMTSGSDQARKVASLKWPSGQPGSGNMWSLFEDQALVVLVHDLGPNWELVSDAINNTLQFMCIFRKPDECKKRHKILMDQATDDGADSAEDSGSSQPYPSTLPGIPKGSARQLFQRLQGPVEHDTLQSHFEKIMSIRKKPRYQRNQNDFLNQKQIVPSHNSHVIALSEVCSKYRSGGYLTPLDLCDPPASNLESITHRHQGPHSVLPASGGNSPPGLVAGSNLPSAMGPLNASTRDGKFGTAGTSSLTDEQKKSNSMLSCGSTQQSSLPVSGTALGTDLNSERTVPGANSSGMISGLNSQSLHGGVSFSGTIKMPNHLNSRVNSSQGISTPNSSGGYMALNQESQKQIITPELNLNASQGSNHSTTPFAGKRSKVPGHTLIPMGQTHPVHNQPQRRMPPPQQSQGPSHCHRPRGPSVLQHPAYAPLVKERQLQQQQYSTMTSSTPITQAPMVLQTSHLGSLPLSPSAVTPASQPLQKHHVRPHGPNLAQSGLANQISRQGRQPAHPFYGSGSHHHSQQTKPQQLPLYANGSGTSSISASQHVTDNSSHLNRISPSAGGQFADQPAPLRALSSYSGSTSIPAQPFRPQAPRPSGETLQQKRLHSSVIPRNTVQQTPSTLANGSEKEILSRSSSLHSIKSGETSVERLGNTDQQSKSPKDLDRVGRHITSRSTCGDIAGSTGHAPVNSSSSTLLRTESELYDSVLQNFDNQMSSAGKLTKKSNATKQDPKDGQGILQRQLSSSMAPQQKQESSQSQQPESPSPDVQGNLLTQPERS
ncbi:hypothetical protein QQ045_015331 [Rhodiola kirilowii]